jgi:hypothetical protein
MPISMWFTSAPGHFGLVPYCLLERAAAHCYLEVPEDVATQCPQGRSGWVGSYPHQWACNCLLTWVVAILIVACQNGPLIDLLLLR